MHVIEDVVPGLAFLALLLALLIPAPSRAIEEIAAEEDIADLITTPPPEPEKGVAGRQWAILPIFGFSPEGAEFGIKYEHRNLVGSGFTLDIEGSWATRQQRSLALSIGSPHLMGDRFLILLRARYHLHPQIEFFGLKQQRRTRSGVDAPARGVQDCPDRRLAAAPHPGPQRQRRHPARPHRRRRPEG